MGSSKQDKYNRYARSSLSCTDRFSQNWNRSFELVPDRIEGGILLIHGLTDSPYSMKDLAELFYKDNFYVLALRMPGHGTVPAGLTDVSWKDWMAALKIGVAHVRQKAGSDHPFYLAGYSNGLSGPRISIFTGDWNNQVCRHGPMAEADVSGSLFRTIKMEFNCSRI
jgi:pimeloyl-ACP methyl ester carboxylesterase